MVLDAQFETHSLHLIRHLILSCLYAQPVQTCPTSLCRDGCGIIEGGKHAFTGSLYVGLRHRWRGRQCEGASLPADRSRTSHTWSLMVSVHDSPRYGYVASPPSSASSCSLRYHRYMKSTVQSTDTYQKAGDINKCIFFFFDEICHVWSYLSHKHRNMSISFPKLYHSHPHSM